MVASSVFAGVVYSRDCGCGVAPTVFACRDCGCVCGCGCGVAWAPSLPSLLTVHSLLASTLVAVAVQVPSMWCGETVAFHSLLTVHSLLASSLVAVAVQVPQMWCGKAVAVTCGGGLVAL